MSILDQERQVKRGARSILPFIVFILIGLVAVIYLPEIEYRIATSKTVTKPDPESVLVHQIKISKPQREDQGLHGFLFQHLFRQEPRTAGRSPDEVELQFQEPAEIIGLLISVDTWKSMRLVEYAVGINQKPAYSVNTQNDMLMHVSQATNNQAGRIDEHIWFPEPFFITPHDTVRVGAWLMNISKETQSSSPEVIIYYRWLAPAPK